MLQIIGSLGGKFCLNVCAKYKHIVTCAGARVVARGGGTLLSCVVFTDESSRIAYYIA